MPLKLSITTPEGLVHQGEAMFVVVPALDGELGILPRHAPLIGQLGVGELRVRPASGKSEERFFLSGGFLQILKDQVLVLATRAEPARAIDRARAEEELRRLRDEPTSPGTPADALAERLELIRAAAARVKVASRARVAG
jgi:F-type H+-transporting ATPase subunit epsilon